jgi:WD40 repeat protein
MLGHRERVPGAQFRGDNSHLLTSAGDNMLRLWAIRPMPQPMVFGDPGHRISNARFDFDGNFLVTESPDSTACEYDLSDGHPAAAPDSPTTRPTEIQTLTHDRKRFLTASADGTVQLHDRATGSVLSSFGEKGPPVDRIIVSPIDDRVITYINGTPAHLWDPVSGRQVAVIAGGSLPNPPGDDGRSIETKIDPNHREPYVFSHDGKSIATPVSRGIQIFDSASGRQTGAIWVQHAVIHSVAFSSDDTKAVVSCEDRCAEICDLKTMKRIKLLYGHQGCVTGAVFSPDGTRILTCSLDKTARLWDPALGRELLVLTGHTGGIFQAQFSSDGTRILTVSDDGTARVWDSVSPEQRTRKLLDTETKHPSTHPTDR